MANKALIEAIAEILCTECDGTDFASLRFFPRYRITPSLLAASRFPTAGR